MAWTLLKGTESEVTATISLSFAGINIFAK